MSTAPSTLPHPCQPTQAGYYRPSAQTPLPSFPGEHATAALLKKTVRPLLCAHASHEPIEHRFYHSMQVLCRHYGLRRPARCNAPYPYNLLMEFARLEVAFRKLNKPAGLFISARPASRGTLGIYGHGHFTEVYIPVVQLGYWSRFKKYEAITAMVAGTFAYLRQVAGVETYIEDGWMFDCYNNLYEMMLNEQDDCSSEYRSRMICDLDKAADTGRAVERLTALPTVLAAWPEAVAAFVPKKPWEVLLQKACADLLALWRQYPGRCFADRYYPQLVNDRQHYLTSPVEVLGFYYGSGKVLQEEIIHWLRCESYERDDHVFPVGCRLLDRPPKNNALGIAFQEKLLRRCGRLTQLLHQSPIR